MIVLYQKIYFFLIDKAMSGFTEHELAWMQYRKNEKINMKTKKSNERRKTKKREKYSSEEETSEIDKYKDEKNREKKHKKTKNKRKIKQ